MNVDGMVESGKKLEFKDQLKENKPDIVVVEMKFM